MYPVLLHVGSFELRSYEVVVALTFFAGLWARKKTAERNGLDPSVRQDKKDNYDFWTERLAIAICLWLCTVPFIFFLALLFFGARIAWGAAVTSFVAILLVCNALCRFRLHEFDKEKMT